MNGRPQFKEIKSYDEFIRYYWYRSELQQICKSIGVEYNGSKIELNNIIKEYFNGNIIKHKPKKNNKINSDIKLDLNTKVIECGFACNQKFRDFFAKQVGIEKFKFNVDMVASVKKAKQENDNTFTLGDLLDIYYGKKVYAKYDKSSCQWNQFLKDFCADSYNNKFNNKLEVAGIIWKKLIETSDKKIYSKKRVEEYEKNK